MGLDPHVARRWSRRAAYGLLLLTLLLLRPASKIKVEEGAQSLSDQSQEIARLNKKMFETFGTEEVLLLAYTGKDLFDEKALDLQLDVLDRLEKLPLVRSVSAVPQVYRDLFGAEDPEAVRDEMLSTPFYKGLLVSQDASVACFLMEIGRDTDGTLEPELVHGADEAAKLLQNAGFQTHLVGPAALGTMLEETTASEMQRTIPPSLAFSILALALLFRSIRATAVSMLSMAISVILTLGIMSQIGPPLNLVTSSMPILVWVLGLANLIHLTKHYQYHLAETGSVQGSISASVTETAMPCAVAILTTAMGFLSLITTRLAPIRQLAVWVSVGLFISLLVSLTIGPLLLEWFRVPGQRRKAKTSLVWTHTLSRLAFRIGPGILVLSAILMAVTLTLTPKLRIEASTLEFLSKDSEFVKSCEFVRTRLTGIFPLDVVVEIPSGWLDPETWPALDDLARRIETVPGVAKVLSPLDMLKKINQWNAGTDPSFYKLPASREDAQALMDLLDEKGMRRMREVLTEDGKLLRMSVLLTATDSTSILKIESQLKEILKALPAPLKGAPVGNILRSMREQLDLVNAQVQSFGTAIVTIYLCILIGLRSWRLTLVSLVPNVMPVFCVFGLMVVTHEPLNTVTVMVASVALGISVEDVIHLLDGYQRRRKAGESATDSIYEALDSVGPAVAMTTVTACIGFLALVRSNFMPIRSFGILASVAMMVALMNNLFLVPAILTFRERCSRKRGAP